MASDTGGPAGPGAGRPRSQPQSSPSKLDRWGERFHAVVWEGEGSGFFPAALQTGVISAWKFKIDKGFLRASALTYTSLLSLVPLFALAFSVLKGLGVQNRIEPLILENIAVGNEQLVARIVQYIDHTDMSSLGVAGLLGLIVTAVSLLGNIERSLNDIWQIPQGRSYLRMLTDYVTLVIVSPVLLLASLSLTTTIHSKGFLGALGLLGPLITLGLKAIPFVASWLALTAVYVIMPNRSVPIRPALLGGIAAGTLWQLAEWAYIRFQFGVARYNAIYGAMAQLPVLLVWIYASWCIVLLGAELACVWELPGKGRFLRKATASWIPRFDVALPILMAVARRFSGGLPPPEEREIVIEAGFRPGETRRIVDRLVEGRLLVRTGDTPPRLLPARSPDRTPAAELLARIAELAAAPDGTGKAVNDRLRQALAHEFGGVTWAQMALRQEE